MKITINDTFLSADAALEANGYKAIYPNKYSNEHFFTKDGNDFVFKSMEHFNIYIYNIELEDAEFDSFGNLENFYA